MKPVVGNDEVAAILRGLQLDKHFFQSRIRPEPLQELTPAPPQSESDAPSVAASRNTRKSRMATAVTADSRSQGLQNDKAKDFDIYLNEALMPVLAQALDSLCRQINRMEEQGDKLDPRVRERFNPLTWLAQQLLRSHPKCARTPRRQAIYKSFRDWGDQERGRREMLRRKDVVQQVFNGFMLRGTVRNETLPNVLKAIDDTLHLQGVLNGHNEVQRVLGVGNKTPSPRASALRARVSVFKAAGQGPNWTFQQFWYQLSHVIIQHDVVPYTAIQKGIQIQKQEQAERAERIEAMRKAAEERQKQDAEQQRQIQEYVELREPLLADKYIQEIIQENKILTGDDVRPGDAGYEMEVPPKGSHVSLLLDFLMMLGFGNIYKDPETPFDERWWTADLASSWIVLQEMFQADLSDGVVERDTLEKVVVPPEGFLMLKQKVEDEFEQRERQDRNGEGGHGDEIDVPTAPTNSKPSMETLCERTGITMARMDWLYDLFESYVQKDDADEEMSSLSRKYPEHCSALTKDQMRGMIGDMKPDITPAQFEASFRRIDEDGSGEIEFDEFVTWIHEDEVHVKQCKMTFEELAVAHDEPLESIQYLHNSFQSEFPPGEVDGYPMQPVGLPRDSVRQLISTLTPSVSDSEFDRDFAWADIDQKGLLYFDQFLDLLDWGQLPDELP